MTSGVRSGGRSEQRGQPGVCAAFAPATEQGDVLRRLHRRRWALRAGGAVVAAMVRRKGEVTNRHRHLSHPFQVEVVSSGGGMDIMYRWASWHDFELVHSGKLMWWCFCNRAHADAFAMNFGGRRIDRPAHRGYVKVDQPDPSELARRARATTYAIEITLGGRDVRNWDFHGSNAVPFSSMIDPVDVARAQGALDAAWETIGRDIPEALRPNARLELAFMVARLVPAVADEGELAERAIKLFRDSRCGGKARSENCSR